MKFVLCLRLFVAALLLSFLAPSLSRSQTHAQMDSMYVALQRIILKQYPTALFPPIPYDQYDTVGEEQEDGTFDVNLRPVGDFYDNYSLIFPEFQRWDVNSAEMKKDPTSKVYVYLSFYFLDTDSNFVRAGNASLVMVHKKGSAPDQYKASDINDLSVWGLEEIQPYQCEELTGSIPEDHPIYSLVVEHCNADEEE